MDIEELVLKSLFALIALLIVSVSSCTMHANHQASKLLTAGVDGRHIRCSINNGSDRSDLICAGIGK